MGKKVLTFRLTLNASMLLSMPGGDPNSANTLPFISGSAIMGALAGRWLKKECCKDPVNNSEFRSLFLDGIVRYLHAYPEGVYSIRLLPPPVSLRVEKGFEHPVYDLAIEDNSDVIEDEEGNSRVLKPWDPGFIRLVEVEAVAKYRFPEQTARIHHQRDRKAGRALDDSNAVFSYISIDSGERFIGQILFDDETYLARIQDLLQQDPLMLGRSRSAQYGGSAYADGFETTFGENFTETGSTQNYDSRRISVTLLSDYLGVTQNGHYSCDAFIGDFSKKMGISEFEIKCKNSFIKAGKTAGYVSVWQMPRPVRPSLKAGTVFCLDLEKEVDIDRVKILLWEGLGDRRTEGFGRLTVNWHGTKESYSPGMDSKLIDPDNVDADSSPVNIDVLYLQAFSQNQLIHEGVESAAAKFCKRLETISSIPAKSTLGRVRSRLRMAETSADIIRFLEDCRYKKAGKDLDRCRGAWGHKSFFEWLKALLTDTKEIEKNLTINDVLTSCCLTDMEIARQAFENNCEVYQKRLAEMVLQKLTRLKKEEEDE